MNVNHKLDEQIIFEKEFSLTSKNITLTKKNREKYLEKTIDLSKYKNLKNIQLKEYSSYGNKDIKFINYPKSVEYIYSYSCYLDLRNLPQNVNKIDVYSPKYINNDFLNLPSGLIYLKCSSQEITQLDNLPPKLIELSCHCNKITQLDNLPLSLVSLNCSYNKLTTLDNLPESINILICSHNLLVKLDNLPNGLKYLDCSHNNIILLNCLPGSLTKIFAKSNNIESIERLPETLAIANFTFNPLIKKPKCKNTFILLNYSLDSEKASTIQRVIQSGYKCTYGIYYFSKYFAYGIGFSSFLILSPIIVPILYIYDDI